MSGKEPQADDPKADVPEIVSIDALATLFGVTERQARNLAQDAGVTPVARGRWRLADVVQGVVARARASRESDALAAARARAINAKAASMELQMAEKRREVAPVEDLTAALDIVLGTVVDELTGLPARTTRDLPTRMALEQEIAASRARMAKAVEKAIASAATGNFN